jgi:two-component system CheB/CheR fusion protein
LIAHSTNGFGMTGKKSKPKDSKGGNGKQDTQPVAGEAAEGSAASPRLTEAGHNVFPIVGLGASAGGLEALQVFFDHMPPDSGMAFVVVTHQHPDHTSMMPELLARHTSMSVQLITSGTKVKPNCVYVGPPGPNIAIMGGVLCLMERDHDIRLPLPIDYFFRSLAEDQKERAIGIILSGTGTDGTLGLKAIKGAFGMAMVQEAQSAKHTGMPSSAIATNLVDYIVPTEELPQQLIAYAQGVPRLVAREDEPAAPSSPEALRRVFVLLRNRTGHDFSSYKPTTIRRRIKRRMNINHIEGVGHYVSYLQANPDEIDILFRELLIQVTSFFRDSEAFDLLENEVLPTLLANKPDNYPVRIWVPGCSSGEEAYSLAILIREYMTKRKKHFSVQIFATDLAPEAIDIGRKGEYPDGIAVDVKPERLERYFVRADNGYRVGKDIREMVVFATQNLINDPPFAKLDLLSCRNLLIYLDASLQKRLVPLFHYSLKPGGVLFLGSSESLGSSADLFESIDNKWKLYRRKEVATGTYVTKFPAPSPLDGEHPPKDWDALSSDVLQRNPPRNLARLANESLLRRLVPTSLLVNERGDIVHVHGRTGLYFEMSQGVQPTQNIFNMAREGLAIRLGTALRQVTTEGKDVWQRGVRVKTDSDSTLVDLRVGRLTEPEPLRGLFAISFENPRPVPSKGAEEEKIDADDKVPDVLTEVRRELQHTKESHQGTVEELVATN